MTITQELSVFLHKAIKQNNKNVTIITMDKLQWVTAENGEHFLLDTKTGAIPLGLGGKIKNVKDFHKKSNRQKQEAAKNNIKKTSKNKFISQRKTYTTFQVFEIK